MATVELICAIVITIAYSAMTVLFVWAIGQSKEEPEEDYVKPQLKPLTADQIAEIHARGRITPAEMVKEWEEWDLCAPGDGMGGASWRCRKFKGNCHDCLIDFANEHYDYKSIHQKIKEKLDDENDFEI